VLRERLHAALEVLVENDELERLSADTLKRRPELGEDAQHLCEAYDAEIARMCGMLYLLEDPITRLSIDRSWMMKQLERLEAGLENIRHGRDKLYLQLYWHDEGGEGLD